MLYIEQIPAALTLRLRQAVLYPDKQIDELKMDEDEHGIHFGAFQDNKMIGVVSLFQYGTEFQFRKFAVEPASQGKGTGSQMLQFITDFAAGLGGTRLWCNARQSAIQFYLKYGFTPTGEFFSKNNIAYQILDKIL
jgi:phosphoribosylformimino-5-aminoimidazole carboxamide ribotide isomerase